MNTIDCKYIHSDKDLFDYIISGNLSPEEFINNKKIIKELGTTIEKILNLDNGYCLITININKNHNLLLITCNNDNNLYTAKYKVYKLNKLSNIENPVSFKVEEWVDNDNLSKFIYDASNISNCLRSEKEIVSIMITDTLDGYKINKSLIDDFNKNIIQYTKNQDKITVQSKDKPFITKIYTSVVNQRTKTTDTIINKISNLLTRIDSKDKSLDIWVDELSHPYTSNINHDIMTISHIDDIYKIDNKKIALIEHYTYKNDKHLTTWRETYEYVPSSYSHFDITPKDTHYVCKHHNRSIDSILNNIPYNYIDKGRYIVTIGSKNAYKLSVISNDPVVDTNFKESLIKGLTHEIDICLKNNIKYGNTGLNDESTNTHLRLYNYTKNTNNLQNILSSVKSMSNEFLYVIKRQKAKGSNLKITNNVTYNHSAGKLKYNDFSLAVNHEGIKETIYNAAKGMIITYFNNTISEQKLIDRLIKLYFSEIERLINSYSLSELDIEIIINEEIKLNIQPNKTKNNFTYINNQRFNKNEVMTILNEITCYRNNITAHAFIKNIGKLGLSVYIGITSGYLYNEKIYKFKKEKGRSNYKLIIDNININIKGKKILNMLYETTLNYCYGQNKIDEQVFKSIKSPSDYIKYKFLIDASYTSFIKKSKEFLNKKVIDIDGSHVKYYDTDRKRILNGIRLQGSSDNWYIIAYDNKESFVFMNSETHEDKNTYKNGTYICMIDQSKIKNNIGYDTVIAKMLSLKNDSMIASQIYNLDEELNK